MDEADVIIYDALISAEILSLIPDGKEWIYVGKRSGHHCVRQEEINQILLREAKAGKNVLRLKGGDPFVFGRGAEEVECLAAEGIPFEIIPGVTSALAVPAYAGIPITHRDFASSFHVITGHAKEGKKIEIPYDALAKLNGTLIFLMGITAMEEICRGLIQAGMDENTPAAVLEKGTTARQRRLVSTLARLWEDAKTFQVQTPAIILVGKVCTLSEKFDWVKNLPLWGKQILTTRPRPSLKDADTPSLHFTKSIAVTFSPSSIFFVVWDTLPHPANNTALHAPINNTPARFFIIISPFVSIVSTV